MSEKCRIIEPVDGIDKKLYDLCVFEYRTGFVEVGDEKICLPLKYKEIADKIENFQVRDTDVFIVSHPKAGTTWTQEMAWLILHDLDYEAAKNSILERYTFLELDCILDFDAVPTDPEKEKDHTGVFVSSIEEANNFKGFPRLIKTHLPWSMLPKALRDGSTKAKIVYVARNPKDVCVSYYHHSRNGEGYSGSFEDFCQLFLAGRVVYGPFWQNVLPYWQKRNDSNLIFVKFEDMKTNLSTVIRNVSDFLINKQYSDEEISVLEKHLSFESMKNNPSVNYEEGLEWLRKFLRFADPDSKFMRAGKVGTYKQEMSEGIIEEFDKWTEENTEGSCLKF